MRKLLKEAGEVFVIATAATAGMLIVVAIFLGLMMLVSGGAKAQDIETVWATKRFCGQYAWDGSCAWWRFRRVRQHRPVYYEPSYREAPVRYYAAPRRDYDQEDDRRHCKPLRRAVGDQHLTMDGAKKAANDAWAAAVRFHWGEKFIDLSNAQQITYTCSRSSIKEGGTSVTTLGAQLNRCEIEAIPCAPQRQGVEARIEREER